MKARVLSRHWVVGQLGACRPVVHGCTLSCRVVGTSFFDPARPSSVVLGDALRSQEAEASKFFCSCARFVRIVDAHLGGAWPFCCDLLPEYRRPALANTAALMERVELSYTLICGIKTLFSNMRLRSLDGVSIVFLSCGIQLSLL